MGRPKSAEYRFEMRRVANWLPLGLMYAAFYMSRYNFTVTNPALCREYGWSNEQIGWVISFSLAVYGLSVFFNGPLADKIGGKRAILIGSAGALAFNLLFAVGTLFGALGWDRAPFATLLTYLTVIWALNMYFQSFGALSVVKVNAAWFHISERGIFAGLFGAMIQFGRILAVPVGGIILATSSWVWVHIIPAVVLAAIALLTIVLVRDTPEELGYPRQDEKLAGEEDEKAPSLGFILRTIFANPTMWIITGAMMCTGLIRHTIEQWAPKYFMDVHKVASDSTVFLVAFAGQVMIGIFGAFVMGNISDRYFASRRGPVTAMAYGIQVLLLVVFAVSRPGPWAAALILMVLYFFLNGCHGLIAGTASMDFGGRKAAATAAGLLDGSQYLVGSLAGVLMGWVLDRLGWGAWAWGIIPFALIASVLMATRWYALPARAAKKEETACSRCGASYTSSEDSCPNCGAQNERRLLARVAIAAKEAFNTGVFAVLMFLFPLVILLSKALGGMVRPETASAKVTAVLVFCLLGVLVGWLALKRARTADDRMAATALGGQYAELVVPARAMAWVALVFSALATVAGAVWLYRGT